MLAKVGKAGTGDTLGLTVTPPQTGKDQRNEDGLGPFHEKTSKVSAMLKFEGDYIKSQFLCVAISKLLLLTYSFQNLTGLSRVIKNLEDH